MAPHLSVGMSVEVYLGVFSQQKVTSALAPALGDPKRAVRKEATRCRNKWCAMHAAHTQFGTPARPHARTYARTHAHEGSSWASIQTQPTKARLLKV